MYMEKDLNFYIQSKAMRITEPFNELRGSSVRVPLNKCDLSELDGI